MVGRIAFWSCFGTSLPLLAPLDPVPASKARQVLTYHQGLGVRFWQMGIEMRPFFNKSSLWVYPVYAAGGASFGYWMQGVDDRQTRQLDSRKEQLLEKRARKAARDAEAQAAEAS